MLAMMVKITGPKCLFHGSRREFSISRSEADVFELANLEFRYPKSPKGTLSAGI